MMESTSSSKRQHIYSILGQIEKAIFQLIEWNSSIHSVDDYYESSQGMQVLAASCMLIEAIGESVHQIDKLTEKQFLALRPEIPWEDVVGIRNHIAHGYFDIDGEIVLSTVQNDLPSLAEAIGSLKNLISE